MSAEVTRKNGKAAEKYAEFVGKNVMIYYRDMRDTDRKLHGVITRIEGDTIFLQNGEWTGALNCRNARVSLVSEVAGWNKEKRSIFSRFFK